MIDNQKYIMRGMLATPKSKLYYSEALMKERKEMVRKPGRPRKYPRELMVALCIFQMLVNIQFRQLEGTAIKMIGSEMAPSFQSIHRFYTKERLNLDDI